jgi:hypothetical protein
LKTTTIRSFPVAKKKTFCYYDALFKRYSGSDSRRRKNPMKKLKYVVPLILVIIVCMSCKRGGTLQSIAITPPQSIISEGTRQQLTATATFSDGTTVIWTSASEWGSDMPDIAPVGNSIDADDDGVDEYGIVSAITYTPGTVTITATDTANAISGSAIVYVTRTPLIEISVVTENDPIISAASGTIQFDAIGTYADGTKAADGDEGILPALTDMVTWSSSDENVATINNDSDEGPIGQATAVAAGTTTITATDSATGVSGSTILIVQ